MLAHSLFTTTYLKVARSLLAIIRKGGRNLQGRYFNRLFFWLYKKSMKGSIKRTERLNNKARASLGYSPWLVGLTFFGFGYGVFKLMTAVTKINNILFLLCFCNGSISSIKSITFKAFTIIILDVVF